MRRRKERARGDSSSDVERSDIALTEMRRGAMGRVVSLPDDATRRAQCIRLGIREGEQICCLERLPGATMVIQVHRQEIALGRGLAAGIVIAVDRDSNG